MFSFFPSVSTGCLMKLLVQFKMNDGQLNPTPQDRGERMF